MKLNKYRITTSVLVVFEIIMFIILFVIMVNYRIDSEATLAAQLFNISSNLLELNNSIVVALIIAMIIGNSFNIKGRRMKLGAKNAWLFIVVNSIIMAIHPLFGIYGIVVVIPAFLVNLIKISLTLHNSLQVF